MFKFTINGRHYNQTTKEIVGQDVIQAMIDLFQSKIASGSITQVKMTQHLERIFTEQPGRSKHPIFFSNQVTSVLEYLYDLFVQEIDKTEQERRFSDSNVVHSYHEYLADVLGQTYCKTREDLTGLINTQTKDAFVNLCKDKKYLLGYAKNKVPTENNEMLLILLKLAKLLDVPCTIDLQYENDSDDGPTAIYDKVLGIHPFKSGSLYVNPLMRSKKRSSALLFISHFWSEQFTAYSSDHNFIDSIDLTIQSFTYTLDRGADVVDVNTGVLDPLFSTKWTQPLLSPINHKNIDLSKPLQKMFGRCTAGKYCIRLLTKPEEKIDVPTETENMPDDISIELHPEYGHDKPITSGIEQHTIVFSDPNSGKTFGFKTELKGKLFELAYQNPRNVTEWKKTIMVQHISKSYHVGTLLSAIATASLNPEKEFYVLADEVGIFNLDWILGANLKKIFKSKQRIDFQDSFFQGALSRLTQNSPHSISLEEFKILGEMLAREPDYITSTTRFTEGEHDLVLWFPKNVHCIFLSNYEDEILASLSELKGWGPNGHRFNIRHYYALEDHSGLSVSFKPANAEASHRYNQIKRYNNAVYLALMNLNTGLSRQDKAFLRLEMIVPRLLISTFEPEIPTTGVCDEDIQNHILSKLDRFILLETELKQTIEEAITAIKFTV